MIPLCVEEGVGIIPWSPLARGFLAGNRSRKDWGETIRAKTDDYGQRLYYQDSDFEVVDRVAEVARKKQIEPIQIALAWLLNKPYVTAPIVGVSKAGQLDSLLGALEVELTAEDQKFLEECYKPHVPQEYK
jgi:aryl-alcohol dehydrogenase (NADP+)